MTLLAITNFTKRILYQQGGLSLWVGAVFLIGAYCVYHNEFLQDDAFISYNYAKWFARGYGLVWYPGSTEFGYTNFLYTFLIGLFLVGGVNPVIASAIINTSCFFVSLALVYRIINCLCKRQIIAIAATLILATNPTFSAYATGGLETMFITALLLWFYSILLAYLLSIHKQKDKKLLMYLGVVASLAMLTRLDSILLIMPGYAYALFISYRSLQTDSISSDGSKFRRLYFLQPEIAKIYVAFCRLAPALISPCITMPIFFLTCYLAYGHMLPNTFYIKMPGHHDMTRFGLNYLWLYCILHLYSPVIVPGVMLAFFATKKKLGKIGSFGLLLFIIIAIWLTYIAYVGGDFMEFRFLVLIMPFYYIFLALLISNLLPLSNIKGYIVILVFILAGNWSHDQRFHSKPGVLDFTRKPKPLEYAFIDSTDTLNEWVRIKNVNWQIVGKSLYVLFPPTLTNKVIVSALPVGAIAYYSDLPIFDLVGLNSRVILSEMNNTGVDHRHVPRPGHMRLASTKLIRKEKVNLNIMFPLAVCKRGDFYKFVKNEALSYPYDRRETLLLPLNNGCFVIADYVTKHPEVDDLVRKNVIIRYRDIAKRSDCPFWICLN